MKTAAQRAAMLCALAGVAVLVIYKAIANSSLERAVSNLEQRAR
jgi:hypothetical protein